MQCFCRKKCLTASGHNNTENSPLVDFLSCWKDVTLWKIMKNIFPELTHFPEFNILIEKPKMVSDSLAKQEQTLKSEHDVTSSLLFTLYRLS